MFTKSDDFGQRDNQNMNDDMNDTTGYTSNEDIEDTL